MKRNLLLACVSLALWACAGCGTDYYVNEIISPRTFDGKFLMSIAPSGDELIGEKKIDLHRRIAGTDGDEMDVWVIKAKATRNSAASRATIVVLHGLNGCKAGFPFFGTARLLSRKGYDVILMDLRCHGRSGGKYVTFGAKEKHDVKAVVDALVADSLVNPTLYAFGVDLGGSVAIQYAAIDNRCKGVVADTPYPDVRTFARRKMPLLNDEKFDEILALAGKRAKFNPADASPVVAAGGLDIPVLLIHRGNATTLSDSKAILNAAVGPKRLDTPTIIEQTLIPATMEDWLAGKIDDFVTKGITEGPESDEKKQ